jgi:hypothetical protein
VAWLKTPAPPGGQRTGLGDALDARRELLRVRGPQRANGALALYDALGRSRAAPAAAPARGKELDFELELRGGDVLIAELPLEPN